MKEKNDFFICKELDEKLEKRVKILVVKNIVKFRGTLIKNWLDENLSKFSEQNRLLTSTEVMDILQISRPTLNRRIKSGKLVPINPNAKKGYRFNRNEVFKSFGKEGGSYDR